MKQSMGSRHRKSSLANNSFEAHYSYKALQESSLGHSGKGLSRVLQALLASALKCLVLHIGHPGLVCKLC